MNIPIIYQDERLLVIDKPSGLTVNRSLNESKPTLQDWSEKIIFGRRVSNKENQSHPFYQRAGIVHRLDRETSGIILIAKDIQAFVFLQNQFKNRQVQKKYLALVHGLLSSDSGTIKAPVGRLPWRRTKFGVLAGGREAETYYKVIETYIYQNQKFSLLEVAPKSGRTHQIRIHLKYINAPLLSDFLYAGRKYYRQDIKFCPRLFLHACYIRFIHPTSRKEVEFVSRLPQQLDQVLKLMKSKKTLDQPD